MLYKNILLVDDDVDDTEIFLDALHSLQTDAICHAILNPGAALAELKIANELPDLIFLDYNMPAMNGLEFLKKMKAESRLKGIEVILISTPPEEYMYPLLLKNNFKVQYISKPHSYSGLQDMLSQFVK